MSVHPTERTPLDDAVVELLATWLPGRRWFPAKGADATLTAVGGLDLVDPLGEGRVRVVLVRATTTGQDTLLQVPVVVREVVVGVPLAGPADEVPGATAPAWIGDLADPHRRVSDATADPAFLRAWLAAADGPVPPLDAAAARALTGEQSNTSVVLPAVLADVGAAATSGSVQPGAAILKVFRALSPGDNPDVDVPRALAAQGWPHVPQPWGWLQASWPQDGAVVQGHLAVLSQFVAGAQDGFELACAMAGRGESFAALAADLGAVMAQMHRALATALPVTPDAGPTGTGTGADPARSTAQAVRTRFAWASAATPDLVRYADRVEALALRTESSPAPPPQRIHGDLHLGQALRTPDAWFITDFEGEPLAPVAERTRPDLALRDVAGMLRSFDYAASVGGAPDGWTQEARDALLAGYAAGTTDAPAPDDALLRALELDKALYEAVYEARNRPTWLPIPIAGIERLLG